MAQHFEGDDPAAALRRLKAVGVVIVVVDGLLQRGGVDWNALFAALSASSRTEYTFDNFGLRYSELEGEIERAIGTIAVSRSR